MTAHHRQQLLFSNIFQVASNINEIVAGSFSGHLIWSEIYNNTTDLIPSRLVSNRGEAFNITQPERELLYNIYMSVVGWIIKWTCGLVLLITTLIWITGWLILIWATIGLNPIEVRPDNSQPIQHSVEYNAEVEIISPVIVGAPKKSKVSNIYNNPKLPPKKN